MNSDTKLLTAPMRFLLATTLLCLVALSGYSQEWKEAHILNHNESKSWEFNVLLPGAQILSEPDPALGTVTTSFNSGKLTVTFEPEDDAIGVAEFVVEHFASNIPPRHVTSKFRVFVDSSLVFAEDDYFAVNAQAVGQELDVLANDSMRGGEMIRITDIAILPEGSASIGDNDSVLVFTPDPDYTGMIYMTYVVCDEWGSCDAADVSICVLPQGGLPSNDTIYLSTNNKSPVVAYMPTMGFELETQPQYGVLEMISQEAWEYTPDDDYSGEDFFVMSSDTLTRTVMINVHHLNGSNYYALNDVYYTRVDSAITFDVRLNDYKAFPIHSYELPDYGTLEIDEMGVFTYTPEEFYVGAVEFEYQIKPTSGIESARVVIFIGDMPPKNVEEYNLVTPVNTPLLINYEIPLESWHLQFLSNPEHGIVYRKQGWYEDLQVGCDQVSGWDMLVYEPYLNFEGQDTFKIKYCVDNAQECTEVLIYVDVQSFEGLGECNCIDNCVWPGDTDANGIVNMDDLLKLGWYIGSKGHPRNYPNNSAWLGQYADDWKEEDRSTGMNLKYADCNGDGVLSDLDKEQIDEHFLQSHDLVPDITGLKADYEFTIIPPAGPLDSGDLAVFEIEIGTPNDPVVNMHGLRFTLNIPEDLYEEGSIDVYYEDDSWLGHDAPKLKMSKEPEHGRLDVGFSRANATTATGAGRIITMTFIVVDDIDGFFPPGVMLPFNIYATNVGGLDAAGDFRSLPDAQAQFFYRTSGTLEDSRPLTIDDQFYVFPNPAQDVVNLHINGKREIEEIELYDMTGGLQFSRKIGSKRTQLDVSSLAAGTYVIRVKATDGVTSHKIQVVR